MPTLISETTRAKLDAIRAKLVADYGAGTEETPGVGDVSVPWAGAAPLVNGIYYVGTGSHKDIIFEAETYWGSLQKVYREGKTRKTPYWAFLNRLTYQLYGATPPQVADRWGWSNLIKIGWSAGRTTTWNEAFIAKQAEACGDALAEELTGVRNSLVLITSKKPYMIIERAIGDQSNWNKDQVQPHIQDDSSNYHVPHHLQDWSKGVPSPFQRDLKPPPCVWWKIESATGNLIVLTDLPKPVMILSPWESTLKRIFELCSEHGIPVA